MKRGLKFLAQISLILISLLLIDGGKTFILLGNNIHYVIVHRHNGDLETPGHENLSKIPDEERWLDNTQKDPEKICNTITHFSYIKNLNPTDFAPSIWQPPEIV